MTHQKNWRDQHPLMMCAFVDFLFYVVGSTDYPAEWEKRTGKRLPTGPKNGIEAMIDKACGFDPLKSPALGEFVQAVYDEMWAG